MVIGRSHRFPQSLAILKEVVALFPLNCTLSGMFSPMPAAAFSCVFPFTWDHTVTYVALCAPQHQSTFNKGELNSGFSVCNLSIRVRGGVGYQNAHKSRGKHYICRVLRTRSVTVKISQSLCFLILYLFLFLFLNRRRPWKDSDRGAWDAAVVCHRLCQKPTF